MRSKHRVITIIKAPSIGAMPGMFLLGQRHLEKENPEPVKGAPKTFSIPSDVIDLASDLNDGESHNISRIEFTYK